MASSVSARPLPRTVVLVLDHDDEAQARYSYALSAFGFDVTMAHDAGEAFDRASQGRPDIILAAVAGTGEDDWGLVGHLKRSPRTRDVPLVAITTSVTSVALERAHREGCAALCSTSCPPDELALGLRALLNQESTHNGGVPHEGSPPGS